jgi:hypothetical protein
MKEGMEKRSNERKTIKERMEKGGEERKKERKKERRKERTISQIVTCRVLLWTRHIACVYTQVPDKLSMTSKYLNIFPGRNFNT